MSFEVDWSCTKCFESSRQQGRRIGVRGGHEEKHSHVRHQTGKRKGGGGMLCCYLFVFDLIGHRRKKKEIPALAKHSLSLCLLQWFSVVGCL